MKHVVVSVLAALAVAAFAGEARAAGGSYTFAGGTAQQQATVRAALDTSSFDWSVVPTTIRIVIVRGHESEATRGTIWLDADLLDSGRFSWGVVQHEYAHQVDFFLLGDLQRAQLAPRLGGLSWWAVPGLAEQHEQLTSERFASTLAWSYWPAPDNVMRPASPKDESAALPPAEFRALASSVLSIPLPASALAVAPVAHAPLANTVEKPVRLRAKSPRS